MYWMKGFLLSCLITLVRSVPVRTEVDKKRHYCGSHLANALSSYCDTYHTQNDYHHEEDRRSGRITNLCCDQSCSLRELLDNFCKIVKPEFDELFAGMPSEQERTNAIVPNKAESGEMSNDQEIAITPRIMVTKRPAKRNNNNNRHVRRISIKSKSSSSPQSKGNSGKRKRRRCRCCCKQLRKMNLEKKLAQNHPHAIIGYDTKPANPWIYVNKPLLP